MVDGLITSLSNGLFLGLFVGSVVGLFLVFVTGDIEPVENLRWSWQNTKMFYQRAPLLKSAPVLTILWPFWQVGGLIAGLRGPELEKRFNPNQGIWKSTQYALVITPITALILGLPIVLVPMQILGSDIRLFVWLGHGLTVGLGNGVTAGLIIGGSASIRHFTLRLRLYRMGHIPWNYARFLDHAADRLFLQKVGGGYIFIHRMLLEHFAQMENPK